MQLHEIRVKSKRKGRKRIGRGNASGRGTYAGKGMKGQKSRAGYSRQPGFEGGQTTLIKQTPKLRGYKKSRKRRVQVVNIKDLDKNFKDKDIIDKKTLLEKGLLKSRRGGVKLLGTGETKKAFTVKLDSASKSAMQKIKKAGGKVVSS